MAQIYCQNEGSENAPLNPRLVAFQRVSIPAGSCQSFTISVNPEAFKVVNENGEFVSEGKIVMYVGMGQPDARTEELTGYKAVKLELND